MKKTLITLLAVMALALFASCDNPTTADIPAASNEAATRAYCNDVQCKWFGRQMSSGHIHQYKCYNTSCRNFLMYVWPTHICS